MTSFDVIVYSVFTAIYNGSRNIVVYHMRAWFLDSELSTCFDMAVGITCKIQILEFGHMSYHMAQGTS